MGLRNVDCVRGTW